MVLLRRLEEDPKRTPAMKKLIYALLPTVLLLPFIFMQMKKDPARDFLNSLSPELLQKALLELDHSEKTN